MMVPKQINSIMINGKDLEPVLFECALYYAEQGHNVWFISPKSFEKLPNTAVPPDKDVLKLITFLYLEDYNDLINYLSDIHKWRLLPNVIILNCYEQYCCLTSSNTGCTKHAFLISLLLDAVSVCRHKNSTPSLLLACIDSSKFVLDYKLKNLLHLYFEHLVEQQMPHEKGISVDNIICLANLVANV